MARHGQFNKSKRRYKNISSRKRNCKGNSFVNCDDPEPKERTKYTSTGIQEESTGIQEEPMHRDRKALKKIHMETQK